MAGGSLGKKQQVFGFIVSPKHAADSVERASVSCKTKPHIFSKSALFWWHQALLCTLGNIHGGDTFSKTALARLSVWPCCVQHMSYTA